MQPASKLTDTAALPARLVKGTELAGYVVDGWLRDGGMAAIYRAHRATDATRVALKLQLPSTTHLPEICARFDREAEAMQRVVGEPHVVELHRAGVLDDGRRYFVMEWVEGDNLEELLDSLRNQDQRLPVSRACEIGLHIAQGLAALHEHGLVHRDLKPANVMVGRPEHEEPLVKLVDFGIVADLAGAHDEGHATETVMGTSAYMAPEQVAGHPPTPAMDVFALGVVLYETLTGSCVPADGWSPETLPTIDSLRRHVPTELVALVRACMASNVEQRPRSGTEVARELAAILRRMQASAARLVSSEEIPIRTGSTTITPRSQVAAREQSAVRTGGTEVVLTHEQVLTTSGMSPVRPVAAVGDVASTASSTSSTSTASTARSTSSTSSSSIVASVSHADAAADDARPKRRWWLVLAVLVPVVVGVSWVVASGGDDDDGGTDGASKVAVPSHGPPTVAVPTKRGPTEAPLAADAPPTADLVIAPDPPAAPNAADGAAPPAEPEPNVAPGSTDDTTMDPAEPSEPAASSMAAKPRPKGPDKAACEKLRAEATAAKARRHWTGVLEGTKQSTCWSGAAFKLDRRRLRVEAYAETASYARCVKEGGSSTDSQISARVKWCSKKLGEGA